jgi:AcrR family transcriptional regulator
MGESKVSQKRDQLLKAGEALFIKHGMRRVTVKEICQEANVSKPTFYKLFENKEALAREIVLGWIDDIMEQISEIEEADVSFPEKLREILAIKQELSTRPGPEFFQDLIPLDIDLGYALQRVMRFLTNGQQNGDIRADIRPEVLMTSFNLLNSMQHDHRILSLYEDNEKLATDVFKLFHYGALSAKHREQDPPEPGEGSLSQNSTG